eukprot:XP_024999701.1 serine/arginine-rich splicing factor SR45-like [Gallus gallus]
MRGLRSACPTALVPINRSPQCFARTQQRSAERTAAKGSSEEGLQHTAVPRGDRQQRGEQLSPPRISAAAKPIAGRLSQHGSAPKAPPGCTRRVRVVQTAHGYRAGSLRGDAGQQSVSSAAPQRDPHRPPPRRAAIPGRTAPPGGRQRLRACGTPPRACRERCGSAARRSELRAAAADLHPPSHPVGAAAALPIPAWAGIAAARQRFAPVRRRPLVPSRAFPKHRPHRTRQRPTARSNARCRAAGPQPSLQSEPRTQRSPGRRRTRERALSFERLLTNRNCESQLCPPPSTPSPGKQCRSVPGSARPRPRAHPGAAPGGEWALCVRG